MATRKTSKARKVAPRKPASVVKVAAPRKTATKRASTRTPDVPSLFRINIEVGDLDTAAKFYGRLLGQQGRKQPGARCYFTAGAVALQLVDVSAGGAPHPAAKALYFTVRNLDAVHARAKALGCLSRERVHGTPAGDVVTRPWGERSFYAEDAWGNPLCFVDAKTVFPG